MRVFALVLGYLASILAPSCPRLTTEYDPHAGHLEVHESPQSANAPNEDWLALSNSISALCEADLMALDEDLQDVPWGLVPPDGEHVQQILSPLSALGVYPLPSIRDIIFRL